MNDIIIDVVVTDDKIWNKEEKIVEIVGALQTGNNLQIHLSNVSPYLEGPCARYIGLYSILDNITNTLGFNRKKITIYTKNLKETHDEYNIVIEYIVKKQFAVENISGNREWKEIVCNKENAEKTFDSHFKHFGCFINRSNWQRLWISSHLYNKHVDKSYMSFHYSMSSEYHLNFLGVDELFSRTSDANLIEPVFNLLKKAPLTLDCVKNYPPAPFDAIKGLASYYKHFFVEIVCETFFEGSVFTLTEKTFRPMQLRTPFIVQSSPNFLINLKKLGFKTFDKWWREIYNDKNHLPKDCELVWSTKELLKLIDNIAEMPHELLKQIYDDMKPTLDYNRDTWIEYDNTLIKNISFE